MFPHVPRGPIPAAAFSQPRRRALPEAVPACPEVPMGFVVRNLSVLTYARGFTLWHYRGGELPLGEIAAPGFFDPAGDMLAGGDVVLVSAEAGGCVLFVQPTGDGVRTTLAG